MEVLVLEPKSSENTSHTYPEWNPAVCRARLRKEPVCPYLAGLALLCVRPFVPSRVAAEEDRTTSCLCEHRARDSKVTRVANGVVGLGEVWVSLVQDGRLDFSLCNGPRQRLFLHIFILLFLAVHSNASAAWCLFFSFSILCRFSPHMRY